MCSTSLADCVFVLAILLVFAPICAAFLLLLVFAAYYVLIAPRLNPLRKLAGPPVRTLFGNHMSSVLDPFRSPKTHALYVEKYGRNVRIRGLGPWDERLLPLDPVSLSHVLKNSTIYEKPWQSRRLITTLIGCGMLAAEGHVHKRQRRVATPGFSIQNLRALVPLLLDNTCSAEDKGVEIDVCHWISRATFDVIGLAGFDYHFNAIQNESDELFAAYKEMFETAVSQGDGFRTVLGIYFPLLNVLFPDKRAKTVKRCQAVIRRVAGKLVQSKKARIMDDEKSGAAPTDKDLLSLLLKSNLATDLPPDQRISDEDILHNINTFISPDMQTRLRAELLDIVPSTPTLRLTTDEIESLHVALSNLPYLNNVTRESLRLIPPVHSSLRVATQDDVIPTSYPVRLSDGSVSDQRSIRIPKGSFVHVPVEALNLDKGIWGEDAWEFDPDRWDRLPEASCIGMRFSMIEMKTFLYILLTNFEFAETDKKIYKANVVLTRPYVSGQFKKGSQCPLLVKRYKADVS
ncbi:cytochrome P450 [Melanogaster broomeanus]|nr:cytochrome P450 [Melanogaster broomeanus]